MNEIYDIYKVRFRNYVDFRGTLRNERKFELNQKVFVGYGHCENIEVYPAIVVGIKEDKDSMNPSYIYELKLPEWAIKKQKSKYNVSISDIPFYKFLLKRKVKKFFAGKIEEEEKYINLDCQYIFNSIEEAKELLIANFDLMTTLNREDIDRYCKRFDETNK